jgi:hypothetical protein
MATSAIGGGGSDLDSLLRAVGAISPGTSTTTMAPTTTTGTTTDTGQTTTTTGRTDVTSLSGRTDTSQLMLSDEATNLLVNKILESSQGLASTISGEKAAGLYGTTTSSQLAGNLVARTAAEVAAKSAPTVTTIGPSTQTQTIGGTETTVGPRTQTTDTTTGPKVQTTETSPAVDVATGAKALGVLGLSSMAINAFKSGMPAFSSYLQSAMGSTDYAALRAAGGESAGVSGGLSAATGIPEVTAGELGTLPTAVPGFTGLEGLATEGVGAGMGAFGTAGLEGIGAELGAGALDTAGLISGVGLGDLAGVAAGAEGIGALGTAATAAAEGGGVLETVATGLALWIVCTELRRQNRMPFIYYAYGFKVFAKYDEQGKKGYYIWAVPSVKHLRAHPYSLYSRFLCSVFNARAEYLAAVGGCKKARKTIYGFLVTHITYIGCWILSRTIARNYNTSAQLENLHACS